MDFSRRTPPSHIPGDTPEYNLWIRLNQLRSSDNDGSPTLSVKDPDYQTLLSLVALGGANMSIVSPDVCSVELIDRNDSREIVGSEVLPERDSRNKGMGRLASRNVPFSGL